jgi:sugar lactone lactonase YvrE
MPMTGARSRPALVAALLCVALSSGVARAGHFTQGRCGGSVAGPAIWKTFNAHVLENLLFADGSLWVSDSSGQRIVRLGPGGGKQDSLDGIPPGGLAVGPDGLIYAGWGNSLADSLLQRGLSKVVRFAASSPAGTLETYASGFDMANGLTFAPNGDLFVSNDVGRGPIRIPRTNPAAWGSFGDVWGTNGLVVDPAAENLYAAITFDQRSPIERIPLADPASHQTAAVLTAGVLSLEPAVRTPAHVFKPLLGVKGLDDMTRTADGTLYVVANGTGELLKVNPLTGKACRVASGFRNPSSVRIAPAGSPFDTSGKTLTFYVVEFSGNIRTVGYSPA